MTKSSFHGLLWSCVTFSWSCVAFLWSFMAKNRFDRTLTVLHYSHRSKFIAVVIFVVLDEQKESWKRQPWSKAPSLEVGCVIQIIAPYWFKFFGFVSGWRGKPHGDSWFDKLHPQWRMDPVRVPGPGPTGQILHLLSRTLPWDCHYFSHSSQDPLLHVIWSNFNLFRRAFIASVQIQCIFSAFLTCCPHH